MRLFPIGTLMDEVKLKTARTLKWNTIDKFASQALYAVTGIVLANIVSQEQYGLIGAIWAFQAIATLLIDSGFSNALVQRKNPTDTDYSTVFWFNTTMSVGLYAALWFAAPFIDALFHAGGQLIPLCRVTFCAIIINALSIVQANRRIKQMNVKMIAYSDIIGLVISSVVGLTLAFKDYGAWAIVWQVIALATTKTVILWVSSNWLPKLTFSWTSLKSIFAVGSGVMCSAFLNTIFQDIYSFIIGNRFTLAQLGCYTQADKWSKMGIAPLSSILTTSFLPVLSDCQDSHEVFLNRMHKASRLSAYIYMPGLLGIALVAPALFHILFSDKWDNAVILFQILALRGIFTVSTSIYNNYMLAKGRSKRLVESEVVKDLLIVLAIVLSLPYGITWLVAGQLIAGAVYWLYAAWLTSRTVDCTIWSLVKGGLVYLFIAAIACVPALALTTFIRSPWILLPAQVGTIIVVYTTINALLHSVIQQDIFNYIRKKQM